MVNCAETVLICFVCLGLIYKYSCIDTHICHTLELNIFVNPQASRIWRLLPEAKMKVPMPRFIMACLGAGLFTMSYYGVKPAVEFELNQRLSAVNIGYTQVRGTTFGDWLELEYLYANVICGCNHDTYSVYLY